MVPNFVKILKYFMTMTNKYFNSYFYTTYLIPTWHLTIQAMDAANIAAMTITQEFLLPHVIRALLHSLGFTVRGTDRFFEDKGLSSAKEIFLLKPSEDAKLSIAHLMFVILPMILYLYLSIILVYGH